MERNSNNGEKLANEGMVMSVNEMRIETDEYGDNLKGNETTYWGVLCRSCVELVAFDIRPYRSFGPGAADVNRCAIRCSHGHSHVYFPSDFQFFYSDDSISEAVMQGNREAYTDMNRSCKISLNQLVGREASDHSDARVGSVRARAASGSRRTAIHRDRGWFSFIKALVRTAISVRIAPGSHGGKLTGNATS